MNTAIPGLQARRFGLAKYIAGFLTVLCLLKTANAADYGSADEYKVKALFILKFARYVEWPESAFGDAKAPITIGIVGKDDFKNELKNVIAGKTVGGREFVIRHLSANDDPRGCQILFVSNSETRADEILAKTVGLPILTVGEDHAFGENGGMINMVLKNDRVQLKINLAAANKAGLKISSRLLALAVK